MVATYFATGLEAAFAQTLPALDTARVLAALESEARETYVPGESIAVVVGDRRYARGLHPTIGDRSLSALLGVRRPRP